MKNGIFAVAALLILAGTPARAQSRDPDAAETMPKGETWKSMTMEAQSLKGEMMYQDRDFSAAREEFRDSLGASTRLREPQGALMGLDLYRTAEIEAREGHYSAAKQHLEILINRFPDSDWAQRGQTLLNLIPRREEGGDEEDEAPAPRVEQNTPESYLRRLQAELKDDKVDDALRDCRAFLERYPGHNYSAEVRLIEAIGRLRLGDAAQAARELEPLARGGDAGVAAKARYLLGGAYLQLGDPQALRAAVPAVDPAKARDKWTAMSQVWRAASDARLGRHDQAAAAYRGVLQTSWSSPLKPYATAALAAELQRRGQGANAVAGMRRAAEDARRWGLTRLEAAARMAVGDILYGRRKYAAAAAAYEEFARGHGDDPSHPQALYQRGLALKRSGRKEEALGAFERLVEAHPNSPLAADGHLQLGQLYTEMGRASRAIRHYEEMGKVAGAAEGSGQDWLLLVAQVHYNRKEYKDAIPYYWKFLEAAAGDPRANEVEELLLTSYWQGAREDPGMARAVQLYPNHAVVAHVLWGLGARAYKLQDWQGASERFGELVARFPKAAKVPDALYYQGESRMRLKDYAGASDSYGRLVKRFPKTKVAREGSLRLAAVLFESGQYEESADAYKRLGAAGGSAGADAVYNRGLALAKAGKKDGALAAYEDLLKRFPRYPRAPWVWFQVATMREALGRFKPAVAAYAKVGGEDRAQALFNAGRIYEKLKNRARAQKNYEALARLRPVGDPFRLHGLVRLGILYELQSKPARALPLYREALTLSRNESLSAIARKRIETLTGASPPGGSEYVTWAEGSPQ